MNSNDGLLIRFRSHLATAKKRRDLPDMSSEVATGLIDGINTIAIEEKVPRYLSEYGFGRVAALARMVDRREAESFTIKTNGHLGSVDSGTSKKLEKITGIRRTAVGSVEGRLVSVNVAQHPRVTIIII